MRTLEEMRADIDEVDSALTALLDRRMALSAEVAAYKTAAGLPVYQARREEELLAGVGRRSAHPAAAVEIYKAILAQSRALQHAAGAGGEEEQEAGLCPRQNGEKA